MGNEQAQDGFRRVIALTDRFENIAKAHLTEEHPTHRKSWKLLFYHTDFCRRYARILLAQSLGDSEKAKELYKEMVDVLSRLEPEISQDFDLFLFDKGTKRKFE